jgi:SAM-dependent methyltransferase
VSDLRVDPANAEQAKTWDGGDDGEFWTEHSEEFDRALGAYLEPFLAAAGIGPAERVLDIGCGAGQTTRHAARAASEGTAHGIDLSGGMIELARRLSAEQGIANVGFEQADAQIYPFAPAAFDLAISRNGTMFFGDPVAAFANIRGAVRSGGRLVMLVWQGAEPNEWVGELSGALAAGRDLPRPPAGAPGPFALADPDRVRTVLTDAGWSRVTIDGLREPMWFGDDVETANSLVLGFMGWMLKDLDDSGRRRALEDLRSTLSRHHTGGGVFYESATWIVGASA